VTLDAASSLTVAVTATNIGGSTAATSAGQTVAPIYNGVTYYISSSGNDSNSGSSGSPWLTPNHAVNCGDTIIVKAGTYSGSNFGATHWGAVSNCPSSGGAYMALVKGEGPYVTSVQVNSTNTDAVRIDKSNWAVSTMSATATVSPVSSQGSCFSTTPSSAATIHHIAFINVVANGCGSNGIASYFYYLSTGYGVDQFAAVGNIAYDAAKSSALCFSGISVYEPATYDTSAGTHIYIAGNFMYGNLSPTSCPGNTDGNGLILDDWNHTQSTPNNIYTQQFAVENNIAVNNGGNGLHTFLQNAAPGVIRYNTAWGNSQSTTQTGTWIGEINYQGVSSGNPTGAITFSKNIAVPSMQYSGGTRSVWGMHMAYAGGSPSVIVAADNYNYSAWGNNQRAQSSTGFSFGTNINTTPGLSAPAAPSAPSCGSSATTVACMSTVISNFSATASTYGYQAPTTCAANSYWPTWLNGAIPEGLVNKPCTA
jgi:hypothetical protein